MTLAPDRQSQSITEFWRYLTDSKLLRLFATIALLMLIPVHIVWYFERRNPDNGIVSSLSYVPGIFQALWWILLALLGQVDNMPKGPIGRAVALFWLVVGIIFVTYFTAIITADITAEELQGNIQTLNDLDNRPVGVLAETQVKDYLYAQNISQLIEFPQLEQAYEALLQQDIDAIIAPRPILLYFASHEGQGKVQVVGTPFRERFYAIVMPKDSPYRRAVNQAILTLKENGTYQGIYRKWFGRNPEDTAAR